MQPEAQPDRPVPLFRSADMLYVTAYVLSISNTPSEYARILHFLSQFLNRY